MRNNRIILILKTTEIKRLKKIFNMLCLLKFVLREIKDCKYKANQLYKVLSFFVYNLITVFKLERYFKSLYFKSNFEEFC